jgi:hypothetical protein
MLSAWLTRLYTQIDSHAILVGPRLRKDERGTRPLCSGVLLYQAQLFELAYLVSHKLQLRRSLFASWYALLMMRLLPISCAESCVGFFCGNVDYDKSG